jgi:uncharacterized protein
MAHAPAEPAAASPALAVFARAPVPGEAKTRLIPRLGAAGAARLQAALIRRALRTATDAALGPVSLWCAPDCSHPVFAACRDELDVALAPQCGRDLGARMLHAFTVLCPVQRVLLIGTDCPALTVDALRAAAAALDEGDDAVFVPAEDGGYVLVGLARPIAVLFGDIAWGSDRVMAQTRDRLRAAGVHWRELAPSWDVDRPEDLTRLLASGIMSEALRGIG